MVLALRDAEGLMAFHTGVDVVVVQPAALVDFVRLHLNGRKRGMRKNEERPSHLDHLIFASYFLQGRIEIRVLLQ